MPDAVFYPTYPANGFGRRADLVLDCAAVPRTAINTPQGQALLMTIAANSVLINRRSDDFWQVERRSRQGAFREITAQRRAAMATRIR